jgi:hypothetical protein
MEFIQQSTAEMQRAINSSTPPSSKILRLPSMRSRESARRSRLNHKFIVERRYFLTAQLIWKILEKYKDVYGIATY